MRPNPDLLHHKLAAAVSKVHRDVEEDSVADLAVVWVLVAVAVKSMSPTFVTTLLIPSFLALHWA